MQPTVFTLENYPQAYMGYLAPIKGKWKMAYFELAEAKRIAKGFNECAEHPMEYDPIYDQFFVWDEGNQDYDITKGTDCVTADGIKHLYGIGSGMWLWDTISNLTCYYLAQQIEEFIFYHDTYHYMDENDLKRYDVVDRIAKQLKELTAFQQVWEIWYNDDLTEELKFEKLGGILNA